MAFVVGIGGIIGALLRYWIGISFAPLTPGAFPLGTFIINMTGSFFLAWLTSVASQSKALPQWLVTGIGTGVIGAFTTFSTFSVETAHLIQGSYYKTAIIYCLLSLLGGWVLALLGYTVGKRRSVQ
jgi:fluoride exporter